MYKEVGQMDPYGAPAPRSERATIYDLSTSMSTTRSNQRHIWLTSETARSIRDAIEWQNGMR